MTTTNRISSLLAFLKPPRFTVILEPEDPHSYWRKGRAIEGGYTFAAKVFDLPSSFGIENGRVSKLEVRDATGRWVINYQRGWDVKPRRRRHRALLRAILATLPTSEGEAT